MKLIFIISTILLLYSCSNNQVETKINADSIYNETQLKPTFKSFLPNQKIDSLIMAFIEETPCDSCIHEMYIDKINPVKTIITLRARVYSLEYLQEKKPLFTVKYDNLLFYLYSGMEDVLIGDQQLMNYAGKEKEGVTYNDWDIIIDSGNYKVKKVDVGIPFFPATPPNIEIKK